jgi:protein-tyrosine phosphatase/nicotinamidase-related amidase
MPLGVLITQCLQRDFVDVLAPHEPVPGPLHIGHREARRLLGEDPANGPVATFMRWAHAQPPERLRILHVRYHHDLGDPAQRAHLQRFGAHCVRGTPGARFVGGIEELLSEGGGRHPNARVVDALTLNDFEGTTLAQELEEARRASPDGLLRVGVVGVWTDAKVSFLLYDLRERARIDALGTCSALTASASRAQHQNALDQLERLLDVRVEHSLGAFASFLLGEPTAIEERSRLSTPGALVKVSFSAAPPASLEDPTSADRVLLAWLYRECRSVSLTVLAGGFSGASVLLAESEDAFGHRQAPSVVKIGPRADIGQERAGIERIEGVLGNNAPSVIDFADQGERGAIRFRYASMTGAGKGKVTSFQKLYAGGADDAEVARVLEAALSEGLGRLYAAATAEPLDLLSDYEFSSRWAGSIAAKVEALCGRSDGDTIDIPAFGSAPNVARFYDTALPSLPRTPGTRHPVSFVHGDLNGQNVMIDSGGNVWIIDFGRLRRGHALRDFAKLENDLLYIMTPLDESQAHEASVLVDALIDRDVDMPLGEPPPNLRGVHLSRVFRTIGKLRALTAKVPDSGPSVGYRIALLRFAAHTLAFDEPTLLQRRWALYACGRLARRIEHDLRSSDRLRIDWADAPSARVGMTLCPGRKDFGRVLEDDLQTLVDAKVKHLFTVMTAGELSVLGVPELFAQATARGLVTHTLPIDDGQPPDDAGGHVLAREIAGLVRSGEQVVVHCRAGLGRTGTIVAATLVELGVAPESAITEVRRARGSRSIETAQQEAWVRGYRPR